MTHVKCYRALQRRARERKEGNWEFRCPECQRVVNSFLPMDEIVFSPWESDEVAMVMSSSMSSSSTISSTISPTISPHSQSSHSPSQPSSSPSSSPFLELSNTLHSLLLHTVSLSSPHQQTHIHSLFANSLQQLQACSRAFCDNDAGWRNYPLSRR